MPRSLRDSLIVQSLVVLAVGLSGWLAIYALYQQGILRDVAAVGLGGAWLSALSLAFIGITHFAHARIARRFRLISEMTVGINRSILLNEDMDRIYDMILDYVFTIFPEVQYGSVLVADDDGWLHFAANRGFTDNYVSGFRLKLNDSFLYRETGGSMREATIISPRTIATALTAGNPESWKYRSVMSAPVYQDGKLFGLFNLDSDKPNSFNASDVRLMEQFRLQIEVCLLARARYQADLKRHNVDALTGLSTRLFFEELFQVAAERATRYGERFVLALFDADGLKRVNDSHGHLAGDRLLIGMANALRATHRKSDLIGRLGGDEFIAVYHGGDAEAMRRHLLELRDECRASPIDYDGIELTVSFCFGLAVFPDDGTTLAQLMEQADRGLYAMKAARPGSDGC